MDLVIQIYPLFPYFWSRHSLAVILDRTDNYAATPSNLSSSYPSSHTSRLLLQTRVVSAVKPAIFSACANQKTGALPYQTPSRLAVILVHRAWQGQKSFLIVAIKLLSTSSVPAAPDFSGDLNIINNIVTSTLATGKAVILVMHSDGAHPGCRVLKVIKQDEAENAMFSNGVTKVGRIVKLALIPRAKRRTVRVEAPNPARALFYEVYSRSNILVSRGIERLTYIILHPLDSCRKYNSANAFRFDPTLVRRKSYAIPEDSTIYGFTVTVSFCLQA